MSVENRPAKHCVFVYGTLKKGGSNHHLLAGFPGISATAPGIALHAGPHYPFAVRGTGTTFGEVYTVDDHTLSRLDALEDHPNDYVRELIYVQLGDGNTVQAWIYLNESAHRHPRITSGRW